VPPRIDTQHTYRWFDSSVYAPTVCRVRVWDLAEGLPLVLVSQPPDAHGTSITNAVAQIAAEILVRYLPERLGARPPFLFVQHYPLGGPTFTMDRLGEDFARVTFGDYRLRGERQGPFWRRRLVGPLALGSGRPEWHGPLPLAAIEALVDEELREERLERDMPPGRKRLLRDRVYDPRPRSGEGDA